MVKIYKEVPVWVIDWVNKVFTVLNDIDKVDDLWLDNIIYINYTFVWKILTLTDAPISALFLDYLPVSAVLQADTTITLWNVKNSIWNNLWTTSISTTFTSDVLNNEINSLISDIYRWRVHNLLNWRIYRAWKLNFINWTSKYRYIENIGITVEASIWDTIIQMETAWLESSWVLLINWDIITYTSITATQIQWVSWITLKYLVWDIAKVLYKMPSNFDKSTLVYKNWVEIIFKADERASLFYNILKSWITTYIKAYWFQKDDILEIEYVKNHTPITDDLTIFPIPDRYWLSVIANIVSGSLWYKKGIPNSQEQLNFWYTQLQAMFQYYTNDINVIKQSIKPISYTRKF